MLYYIDEGVAASLFTTDITSGLVIVRGATAERSCCLSLLLSLRSCLQFLGQAPEMVILSSIIREL